MRARLGLDSQEGRRRVLLFFIIVSYLMLAFGFSVIVYLLWP